MEQCAAPQLESASPRSSPPDPAGQPGGDAGETVKDAYECRICGYKAQDVKCLSQHLHAAHPVTSLCGSAMSERSNVTRPDKRVADPGTPSVNGDLGKRFDKDKVRKVLFVITVFMYAPEGLCF